MTVLSICIPTYNRASLLNECLLAIYNTKCNFLDFEVCVSDNASTDDTFSIVDSFKKYKNFSYERNDTNLGIPLNFLKVVSIAKGKYVWLLGDDDIITTDAIQQILKKIQLNESADFFLFNCLNFKKRDISKSFKNDKESIFWTSKFSGPCKFADILEKNITFDHLGGMYLSVFNRSLWDGAINALDPEKIRVKTQFSSHDNTFPHVRIFAKAFMGRNAYVSPNIICHSFSDTREWHPYFPMIRTFRLLESLDVYKEYGMNIVSYKKLRNKTLDYFIEDFIKVFFLKRSYKGHAYFSKREVLIENIKYFGFWASFVSLIFRMAKKIIKQFKR